MYSTCLYCNKPLGVNDVLETLPIGRRVAFDARQGRLWVVCRGCEKWNLVPFDTRLETIDQCERLFSETRVRFSTDNIGIARMKEGLELVRIGPAQRPEFAAWRYGDQFGRRRMRHAFQMTAGGIAVGGLVAGGHTLLPILGVSGTFSFQVLRMAQSLYNGRRAAVRIPTQDGVGGVVTTTQLARVQILSRYRSWALLVPAFAATRGGFATGFKERDVELRGADAVNALGKILPRLNASGGSKQVVRDAVDLMEERSPLENPLSGNLKGMDKSVRLSLEMAAHEDTERTALAGELKMLERQWQEAEEVAKIADSLAVSDDVDRQVSGTS